MNIKELTYLHVKFGTEVDGPHLGFAHMPKTWIKKATIATIAIALVAPHLIFSVRNIVVVVDVYKVEDFLYDGAEKGGS